MKKVDLDKIYDEKQAKNVNKDLKKLEKSKKWLIKTLIRSLRSGKNITLSTALGQKVMVFRDYDKRYGLTSFNSTKFNDELTEILKDAGFEHISYASYDARCDSTFQNYKNIIVRVYLTTKGETDV